MTLNYIERMTRYNDLKRDYDLQCLENNRKQEQILELRRENRELKERIKELEEINDNFRKQKLCKPRSRQTKKI